MPRRHVLAGALLAAALLLPAGAGASNAAHGKSVTTANEIEAVAMAGPLVAYDTGARANVHAGCNQVILWNVKTGARKKVSGKKTCAADDTSTGSGVAELAIAGSRVAWIVNQGGNTESEDYLYTSTWGKPKERQLASAFREGDVDDVLTGNWIGGLAGSGSLLAVNRWFTDSAGHITDGKLVRIRHGLKKIADGTDTLRAKSVDSGRIAVVRSGGAVAVYSSAGQLVNTFSPAPLRSVALDNTKLLVLTQAKTLQVYGVKSGNLLHTWHAKGTWTKLGRQGSEARLAAYKNVAVYSSGGRIYALNLSNGKNRLVTNAPHTLEPLSNATPRLALSKTGLVYAYDSFNHKSLTIHGHVVFVPMAKVRAKVR